MDHITIEAVRRKAGSDGRLACTDALDLADELGVAPRTIGLAADAAGVKLVECELGLFGPRRTDGDESVGPAGAASEVRRRLAALPDNDLRCSVAWAIARETNVKPLMVGRAASALGLHICECQLGCF